MIREKLILRNRQSVGDIVVMTGAIRDLHKRYPNHYDTCVDTPFPELWENNPYISYYNDGKRIQLGYDYSINHSNQGSNFATGFHIDLGKQLGIEILPTEFSGYIPAPTSTNTFGNYWLVTSGGKQDFTTKHPIPEYLQEVISYYKDRIQFIQVGNSEHIHPPLEGVINLVGKTNLKELISLVYHAQGILSPITCLIHLSAALPIPANSPPKRACVTICGGREPHTYTSYPNHTNLHVNGCLPCCDNGGCWKSRVVPLNDNDYKDKELCLDTVELNGRMVQKCMTMITPGLIINAIENYMKHPKRKYVEKTYER